MPELPEVETVVRQIEPGVVGRTIRAIDVRWLRTLGGATRAKFERGVVGRRIVLARRRAKWIVLELDDGAVLLVHLRMTGRLTVRGAKEPHDAYLRVSLAFDGGTRLDFDDVRKFGRFVWLAEPESVLGELGPEPLDDAFTPAVLHDALTRRRRQLKPLLLDQTVVAGLGNIYVDESLHAAGLHPLARSERLALDDATRLHRAVQTILTRAIACQGSSFDVFYRTPKGEAGSFQDEFAVYDRAGEPCRTCGAPIVRLVVGQRGTHLCPVCQPKSRRAARTRAPRRS
jgi:formamidopyrimidine-DNA glycosylase